MLKTFRLRVNLKSGDFEKKIQILKYEMPNEANFIENLKDSHLTPLGFLVAIQGFGGIKGGRFKVFWSRCWFAGAAFDSGIRAKKWADVATHPFQY